jgi:hypothetical protein
MSQKKLVDAFFRTLDTVLLCLSSRRLARLSLMRRTEPELRKIFPTCAFTVALER